MTWSKFIRWCLWDVWRLYQWNYGPYHIRRVWWEWRSQKFLDAHRARTAHLRRLFEQEEMALRALRALQRLQERCADPTPSQDPTPTPKTPPGANAAVRPPHPRKD